MCGRFTLTPEAIQLLPLLFEAEGIPKDGLERRYNIAPTQRIAAVRQAAAGRELVFMRWGLIPGWTKDPKKSPLLINARGESVAEKPAFRASFKARRCLVPADGFFEWEKQEQARQPIYFQLQDRRPFAFAGLWDRWQGPEGLVDSCTLITTQANALVGAYHDRMPVIMPREAFGAWLDLEQHDPAALQPMLAPYPAALMIATRVNPRVNSVTHDDPACIEPL